MTNINPLVAAFDKSNPLRLRAATLERLWRRSYGDHYPKQARPNAFYPVEVLDRFEQAVGVAENEVLADLGCGHGGAGLYLAQRLKMRLIGVDLSPRSVTLAARRAAELGLSERATFYAKDVAASGLQDASCFAAISLDVLLYLPDKAAALREAARVVCPGGCFGLTNWEQNGFSSRLGTAQVSDHRPLLESAGFRIEVFEEPRDWRRQQHELLDAIVAHDGDLQSEMGAEAAAFLVTMARGALNELPERRYVFAIARRK